MMMAALVLVGCSKDEYKKDYNPLIDDPKEEQPTKPDEPAAQSGYDEQYRPQIHYTPAKNWINDPNGMVFVDGTYHLFYQYNPQGNVWGNMSWGHATSTDLMHWKEQPVALTRDALGAIFSGSCVIDKNNTSGFGANAMVALYTSAGETGDVAGKQQSRASPTARTAARTLSSTRATRSSRTTTTTCATRRCSGMKQARNGSWRLPKAGRWELSSMEAPT